MNNRNRIIEEILEYKYFDLSKEEIITKRNWLKGKSNEYIYKLYFNEIKKLIDLNEIIENSIKEDLYYAFECIKYD